MTKLRLNNNILDNTTQEEFRNRLSEKMGMEDKPVKLKEIQKRIKSIDNLPEAEKNALFQRGADAVNKALAEMREEDRAAKRPWWLAANSLSWLAVLAGMAQTVRISDKSWTKILLDPVSNILIFGGAFFAQISSKRGGSIFGALFGNRGRI